MKKKFITCALAGLATLTLASCGFDAAGLVANFDDSINTTVKLNYNVNYDVDVTREGGINEGFYKFIHKIRANTVVEMDLGENLYIKTTKEWQDLFVSEDKKVTESVLYEKDGTYYYQSSLSKAVEVPANEVQAKLESVLSETTYEDAGAITLDALLYNSLDKEYEYYVIGQTNGAYEIEDQVDPEYSKNDNGGLHVVYKPEYVGYKTDMGMSDFSNTDDGYAAEVVIDTNDKGYVTSFSETYNSAMLDFAIMEPKPRVTITGSRSFTATYGEEITKVDSVELEPSKAVYEQVEGGTFLVKTCAMGQFLNMTDVANGGSLEMGKIVCVKPTPDAGKEVKSVSVNGVDTPMTDPKQISGWYCFNVVPGANNIVVAYKDAVPTNGVVKVTNASNVAYELQSFTYGANGPENYQVITNNEIVPGNSIFGAIVIDSTTEVTVKVNGVATTINIPANGKTFYCFAVKTGGSYDVVITPAGQEEASTNGVVNVTNASNVAYELQSFTYGATGPENYQVITNNEIVPGNSIFGAIVVDSATVVTVTVNGAATAINIPANGKTFYCFAVKTGGNYDVVITPAA